MCAVTKITAHFAILVAILVSAKADRLPAPTDFSFAQKTPQSNLLGWEWNSTNLNVENLVFKIFYNKQGDPLNAVVVETNQTTYELTNLQNGTNYDVRITAEAKNWQDSEAFVNVFKTLSQDWPTPQDVSQRVVNKLTIDLEVEVTWNIDIKQPHLVYVDVDICSPSYCLHHKIETSQTNVNSLLDYYTHYNVTVTAYYAQPLGQTITRSSKVLLFRNPMGVPQPIDKIEVVQNEYSNEFVATWTPPLYPNGPITYYRVRVLNQDQFRVKEIKPILPNVDLKLPVEKAYTFSVVAVNVDEDNVVYNSDDISFDLAFQMPETPVVLLKNRTDSFLALNVAEPALNSKIFYQVNINGNATVLREENFEIDNLQPFTNVTVLTKVCFMADNEPVCGDVSNSSLVTNVAAPSAVDNLHGGLVGDNPVFVWNEPTVKHGPIDGYSLKLRSGNSTIFDKKLIPKSMATYSLRDPNECVTYIMSVSAYNIDLDTKKKIYGEEKTVELNSYCKQPKVNYSMWAAISIVVLLLLVFLGGLFYAIKFRGFRVNFKFLIFWRRTNGDDSEVNIQPLVDEDI